MSSAFEEVVTELKAEILRLELLHDGLVAWGERSGERGAGSREPELKIKPKPRPKPQPKPKQPTGNGSGKPGRAGASANQVAVIWELPASFHVAVFEERAGLGKKAASSAVQRFVRRGWLKRVGYGVYARTSKLPGGTLLTRGILEGDLPQKKAKEKERVRTPFDGDAQGSVEEKLEQALKDRDTARAAGKTTLETILQDKVDKLQDQLSRD